MNKLRLSRKISRCIRKLKSDGNLDCAYCPFEAEIIKEYPDTAKLFELKRKKLERDRKRKD